MSQADKPLSGEKATKFVPKARSPFVLVPSHQIFSAPNELIDSFEKT